MTDFLYPFIEHDETGIGELLADLSTSVGEKVDLSAELRMATRERVETELGDAAREMAERFASGGRLFTFGNGGSSTDAATLAALCNAPPTGRTLPAVCLVDDSAVITALANDVGFSLVFSRQLLAHARPGDMAAGFSTSGNSEDLLVAFEAAARNDVLTIGFAGYDGGDMGRAGLDHCLVVRSDSVHRVQETQAAVSFALWEAVQVELGERRSDG